MNTFSINNTQIEFTDKFQFLKVTGTEDCSFETGFDLEKSSYQITISDGNYVIQEAGPADNMHETQFNFEEKDPIEVKNNRMIGVTLIRIDGLRVDHGNQYEYTFGELPIYFSNREGKLLVHCPALPSGEAHPDYLQASQVVLDNA